MRLLYGDSSAEERAQRERIASAARLAWSELARGDVAGACSIIERIDARLEMRVSELLKGVACVELVPLQVEAWPLAELCLSVVPSDAPYVLALGRAALPLSLGGAFLGLLIANQPLSLFVLIGLIMLMGIVTKNSILLVDFAIEQIHKGVPRDEALMDAGMKRARPILMTTFAMAAGMLPSAMGLSVDGSLRQGMGVAVIGGLLVSTLLSLLFVPANFVLIDRLERFFTKLFGGKRRHAEGPAAVPAE